jgi:hypothetical protein
LGIDQARFFFSAGFFVLERVVEPLELSGFFLLVVFEVVFFFSVAIFYLLYF